MDDTLTFLAALILGFIFGFGLFVTLTKSPKQCIKEGYEQGQTDCAKGVIKYQCDTLKSGELHCYKLQND